MLRYMTPCPTHFTHSGPNHSKFSMLKQEIHRDTSEGLGFRRTRSEEGCVSRNLGGCTSSYILHTHAFGTYLVGGLYTLQKGL